MKITPHIQAVRIPFEVPIAPGKILDRFVYSYIVSGKEQICLVDSGVSGSEKLIFDALGKNGKNISAISQMILTHAHPDHIGAALSIREKCSCTIGAHPAAREWVEDIEKQFSDRPVPGFHNLVGGSVKIDRILADNDRVAVGDVSLRVLYTPGHSRCSLSLFCEEEGVLFSGDAIPLENDLPIYDDVALAVNSLRKLRKVNGIKYLLASWSDPRPDADPYRIIDDGIRYFQKIHNLIRQLPGRESLTDPMVLCRQMVEKMGLPEVAANPLVARSFSSHLPFIDQEEL